MNTKLDPPGAESVFRSYWTILASSAPAFGRPRWMIRPRALPPPLRGRAGVGGRAERNRMRIVGRPSHFASAPAHAESANCFGMVRPPTLSRPHKEGGDAPRRLGNRAKSRCFSLHSY